MAAALAASALRPIVICGPSGTGKSTLLAKLLSDYPDKFGFSISRPSVPLPLPLPHLINSPLNESTDTTRSPRPGEVDGKAYHFTTREHFTSLIKDGQFIEHAEFSGNFYGTSVAAVANVAAGPTKKTCILDIDTQGVRLIKAHHSSLNPLYVFISPPSLSSLRSRLTGRATDSPEAIEKRLAAALGELEYAKEKGAFDVVIVNDEVERAYEVLKKVVVEGETKGDSLPDFEKE